MNLTSKRLSPSDLLAFEFLEKAKNFNASVELIKVLKSRTYHVGESNVLVRTSSEGNRRYFFGINYSKDEFGRYADKVLENMFWAWARRQETFIKNRK